MKILKLVVLVAITISSIAHAGGQSGSRNIEQIRFENCSTNSGAGVVVFFNNEHNQTAQCSGDDTAISMPCSTEQFDAKYSMLLSAFMSGKKVEAYLSGCDSNDRAILDRNLRIYN